MKKGKNKDWRLGTILTELSLLSADELEFALKMTRSTGMPLGSVLLVTGAISKEELRAMIQAQSMLKDQLVDENDLLSAMPLLKGQQSLGLDGALRRIKWHRDTKVPTNKLGELLVSAKLLSQLDLAKGLAHNRSSLQPLGRTLVLIGALSPRALQHALIIQERIRRGELSREQGITFLRDVCARNELKGEHNKSAKHNTAPAAADMTRLGDLLVEAGLVKEDEFSHAMDVSAYKSQLIGEILIECKLLSRARLQAALELQRLVGLGLVGRAQAIATLKAVTDDTDVSKVLEKNIAEETKKRLLASEALTALASQLTGMQLENPRTSASKEAAALNQNVAASSHAELESKSFSVDADKEAGKVESKVEGQEASKVEGREDGKEAGKGAVDEAIEDGTRETIRNQDKEAASDAALTGTNVSARSGGRDRRKKNKKDSSKSTKEDKANLAPDAVSHGESSAGTNNSVSSRSEGTTDGIAIHSTDKTADKGTDQRLVNVSGVEGIESSGDVGKAAVPSNTSSGKQSGPERERIKRITEHLHFDVLNGTLDVEQAMIVLNICLKDSCSVAQAIAKMGWTVGVRPFRESEINYSDSDLIDWLTQED
jgi:hypothetical protein